MYGVMEDGSERRAGRQVRPVDDEYSTLPAPIKLFINPHEYLFMSDAQKARLIQDETEPEYG